MDIFAKAKFIEKRGLEIVVALAGALVLFSAWVFYFYAWRAVGVVENSGVTGIDVRERVLDEVAQDLQNRATNLEKLKRQNLSSEDIFR